MQIIELCHKGLVLTVQINSYTRPRPAPIAHTPDSPGYDDEGDAGEVDFEVIGAAVDCEDTFIEAFGLDMDNGDLMDAVFEELSDE